MSPFLHLICRIILPIIGLYCAILILDGIYWKPISLYVAPCNSQSYLSIDKFYNENYHNNFNNIFYRTITNSIMFINNNDNNNNKNMYCSIIDQSAHYIFLYEAIKSFIYFCKIWCVCWFIYVCYYVTRK